MRKPVSIRFHAAEQGSKTMLIDPNRLRVALGVLGVSQAELARTSGVSVTTISLVLAGKRAPSRRIAVRIVTGLEAAFKINGGRLDTSYFVAEKRDAVADPANPLPR